MKLSLCNEVIREMPFPDQCRHAAALGYEGLEIAPFTLSGAPHELTAAEIAEVRAALDGEGLVCSSLHWLLVAPEGLSITTPDPAVRRRTLDVMAALIDLAAALDAPVLVHGSPLQRMAADEAAHGRGAEAFHRAGELAAKAGVTYCIEPLARRETDFINTVAEAAAIVEGANPALRTMVDCSAAAQEEGDVAALLERWLPTGLIAHVQVNDANRRGPGQGALKFAPILRALTAGGYDGWVAVEPFDYVPDGPGVAAHAAGYLQGIFETLRD